MQYGYMHLWYVNSSIFENLYGIDKIKRINMSYVQSLKLTWNIAYDLGLLKRFN